MDIASTLHCLLYYADPLSNIEITLYSVLNYNLQFSSLLQLISFESDFISNMAPKPRPKPSIGLPQTLIKRINHLKHLLQHLPESPNLLLDPDQSKYVFFLDPGILSEDPTGITALSWCLEVAFDTWHWPDGEIEFKE